MLASSRSRPNNPWSDPHETVISATAQPIARRRHADRPIDPCDCLLSAIKIALPATAPSPVLWQLLFHQVTPSEGEVVVVAFGKQVGRPEEVRFGADAHTEKVLAGLSDALWHKSSYSACNGNCVAVAKLRRDHVGVCDTKDAGRGPVLVFDSAAWSAFIKSVKKGA